MIRAGRPSLDEALELYAAVGWTAYTSSPENLDAALDGSSLVVCARSSSGRLDGLARAVSDGAVICYLQDILVRPDAQRQGIGRSLVAAVLAHYAHLRQIVLLTDDEPGQRAFYESLGFAETREAADGSLRCFVRFAAS